MSDFFYYFCRELFLLPMRPGLRAHYGGMELVPKAGPALLLSNHISHFDPPLMTARFPRVVHFMADKPLLEIPVLGKLMERGHVFAIDRTKADRGALRTAMARLEGGNVVGIFPEKGIRHGKTSVLGGAELPIGTASLWKMMDVPVIPMVIIGSDQLYAARNYWRRPRVFVQVGKALPPDKGASREELRDRIAGAWRELFEAMKREYAIRPEELPQSAQERWGRPAPADEEGAADRG
ncbi:MAG TPA: lysophospholipid acyltransferase family protein [Candidatus Methylacidiphilales bacterium]|jgi:1-acyl-sn-glycerol-3-phosphate acyltransferase|nr:lysophospholipid acyltransferase family protein [Candidatus Methylacidiphilales bacterium]